MMTLLVKVDPQEHMDRWYMVTIQPTLLDELAVVCAYGSRHTGWQRIRILPVDSEEAAQALAQKIVNAKLRRDYVLVSAD